MPITIYLSAMYYLTVKFHCTLSVVYIVCCPPMKGFLIVLFCLFSFPLNLLLSAKAAISLRPLIQLAMTGQNARLAVSLA